LLLNMSTSRFPPAFTAKRQRGLLAVARELTQSLLLPPRGGPSGLGRHLRIGLRKTCHPRWSRRLPAILCTEPCQGFDFPTIWASAPVLCPLLSCEERLGQLWSSRTRVSKKSSIVPFLSQDADRGRSKDINRLVHLLNGRGSSPTAALAAPSGQATAAPSGRWHPGDQCLRQRPG
jgi:hypothetical protein